MDFIYPGGLPVAMSLTAYSAFLTGLIVLLKRKDRAGKLYFVSSLVIALWGVGISSMLNNELSLAASQAWGRFSNIGAFFIPVTWIHFVLFYTGEEKKYKTIITSFYVLTFCLAPFTVTKWYIPAFKEAVSIRNYPVPGILYHVFALLFFMSVISAFGLFYRAYRTAENLESRKDFKYLGLASFYGFFTGGLSFLPVYGIPLPQYNLLLMPLWQIALAYIMTSHRVFDVQEIADAFQREKMTALGIMAASLNHEIRNPLYIAKGRIETYQDAVKTSRNANAQEIIDSVSRQLDRTLDIMQRFSDFARPQSMAERETVLIADLFRDVFELVSHEIEKKKITVLSEIQENLRLRIHRRQMEEILVNLMINACQAMGSAGSGDKMQGVRGEMQEEKRDAGRGIQDARDRTHEEKQDESGETFEVGGLKSVVSSPAASLPATGTISITAESSDNSVIRIQVSDNGPGISEEMQRRIFDPFFSTKSGRGMGLGLYITKQLVEKNGGKISVKSKPGKGTTFMLEFKA